MVTTLPRDLQILLDDATSEAKKLGHGAVTPAHLAAALARRRPDDDAVAALAGIGPPSVSGRHAGA